MTCEDALAKLDFLALDRLHTQPDFIDFRIFNAESLAPRIEWSLKKEKETLEQIKNNPEKPTFENTILALEHSSSESSIYFSILNQLFLNVKNPNIEEVRLSFLKQFQDLNHATFTDPVLFNRMQSINNTDLNEAQKRLLKSYLNKFEENGLNLPTDKRNRINEINKELFDLGQIALNNILEYREKNGLHVTDPSLLNGVGESEIQIFKSAAEKRNLSGYYIENTPVLFGKVLRLAKSDELRKEVYQKQYRVAPENTPFIVKIAQLRRELAEIRGFPNYASLKLSTDATIGKLEDVEKFIANLTTLYKKPAIKELEELFSFARLKLGIDELKPWNQFYIINEYRKANLNYDPEQMRPYLELNQVFRGAFATAGKLFNLTFNERPDLPTYNPDVKVYEVIANKDQSRLGYLILDPYSRGGRQKNSGAWHLGMRTPFTNLEGKRVNALIGLSTNYPKPSGDSPTLLNLGDVSTIFHELGHALHTLLTKADYPSQAGTRVPLDYVELPSKFFENFLYEPEVLKQFAVHYQTKLPIPEVLLNKAIESKNFLAGYAGFYSLEPTKLDLVWHTTPPQLRDLVEWENAKLKEYNLIHSLGLKSTSFSHIFTGGYAAGYYSYKWAEVLEADAFRVFKENGIFDAPTAEKFAEFILGKGNTMDPMEAFKAFSGRAPRLESLLERDGILKEDK